MILQLIFAAVTLAAIGGALWSYNDGLRKEGAAKQVAEFERQKVEAEKQNTLRALEGEAYALKLLDQAQRRNRAQAAQIATLQKQRQEESDARAKMDPEYREWGDQPVPAFTVQRLRDATALAAADPNRRSVPSEPAARTGADIPVIDGAGHESLVGRIRAFFDRSASPGVDGSR